MFSDNVIEEEYIGDCFVVKEAPGQGLGAYATRLLPKFTLILVEEPLLRGDEIENAYRAHMEGIHSNHNDDECYLRDVVGLGQAERGRVWRLHDQFLNTYVNPSEVVHSSSGEKRLFGIIKSNAYLSTDQNALGIYPTAARLNHSCSPNVSYGFDGWKMRMYTTRDVQPGEELCSCYSDVIFYGSKEYRQAYMEAKFNFECQCHAVCGNCNVDAVKMSDDRRSQLKFLSAMIKSRADHIQERPSYHDLEMILKSIDLLITEGVDHNMATMYLLAYETAYRLQAIDVIREHKLDQCCLSLLEVSRGVDHPATRAFRERMAMNDAFLRVQ